MVSPRRHSANLVSSRSRWSVSVLHGFLPRADQEAFHCGAGIHGSERLAELVDVVSARLSITSYLDIEVAGLCPLRVHEALK